MMTDQWTVIAADGGVIQEFEWGHLRWITNKEQYPEAEMTFGECHIKPGCRNGAHMHPNCDEILYVVSGECIHIAGDEEVTLKPGMAIYIKGTIPHYARCISDVPLKAIISFSSGDRKSEPAK